MKKRINLRLILIAGIAVIVTMVCMTGIYYKLFQGQVRKDLQINARLLSGTGLFDDPDNTNVSLSEYYEVGEDLRVTWIAKDGTVLFDNDLDISQLPNHKNRPEIAVSGVFSSWETFAVKSCRTFAAIRIFSCCLRIVFTNGTSSLYTGSSMVSSMFSASRSIGCSNCLVKKCARTIQMETISISISITNGDAARNTL